MRRVLSLSAVLFFFLLSIDRACAAAPNIAGRWKVYTTLVSAYDPTNPDYQPGDRRLEKWVVRAKKKTATLRTPAGTIQGAKVGKAWVFESLYDTGWGVVIKIHLVARVVGGRLRGTNEIRYYDSRFYNAAWGGYYYILGNDALSFRGTRIR